MSTPLLGSFSLCAACGRDRAASAARCVCDAAPEAWQLVGTAPPGTMLETGLAAYVFGGLALVITLAIASANAFAVLVALVLSPLLGLGFFLGGRAWRTESGAVATTFGGVLVSAEGRGVVAFELPIAGYPLLRGDHAAASLLGRFITPPPLASSTAEVAVVAALIGAASRGSIVLRARDTVRWTRTGPKRAFVERTPSPSAILVEATERLGVEEDKLLLDLLAGHSADVSGSGYRGRPTGERPSTQRGVERLHTLLGGLPPLIDIPSFSARYADATVARVICETQLAQLRLASEDVSLREPVRCLLDELRRGTVSRIARVLPRLG